MGQTLSAIFNWAVAQKIDQRRTDIVRSSFINLEKGRLGEQLVGDALARLPSGYHTFNNLIVPVRKSATQTTQIDHVVTCAGGIIVIETKKFEGTIVGGAQDRRWFQILGSQRFAFPNPLRQNQLHVEVLRKHFGLSLEFFHPVVVFVGLAKLAPGMPSNVISTIAVGTPDLRRYLESIVQSKLSPIQLSAINGKLMELSHSGLTLDDHLRSIRSLDLERRVTHMLELARGLSYRTLENSSRCVTSRSAGNKRATPSRSSLANPLR